MSDFPRECQIVHCHNKARVGAHVFVIDKQLGKLHQRRGNARRARRNRYFEEKYKDFYEKLSEMNAQKEKNKDDDNDDVKDGKEEEDGTVEKDCTCFWGGDDEDEEDDESEV